MKYIVFSNKTKKVVLPPSEKPYTNLTKYVTQCEVESIPSNKYDFLEVDNVQEHTRVVKEAYTIETLDCNDAGEEITVLKEIPAETETYYTCDLIAKFNEYTAEQIEKQKQKKYSDLTTIYFRRKYDENKVEAIQNNYLLFLSGKCPDRLDYVEEHDKMQEYRKECKAKAYAEVYN